MSVRIHGWWDDLRDSLWLIPSVTVVFAVILATLLTWVEPLPVWLPDALVFGGTPDGARAILAQLAGATITVVGLVFSLTVLALQMAAAQFTPRLLRTFLRDRRVQFVLSGMIGSAVYSVGVLRTVRSEGEGIDPFVPRLAVTVAMLLSFVAVGLLVYFLHHVTQRLRVDVVMGEIVTQSLAQLHALPVDRETLPDREAPAPPPHAIAVWSRVGGYLQLVNAEAVALHAREARVRVRLRPSLGDWVSEGTTIAWVWSDDDQRGPGDREDLTTLVHRHVHLGRDRTESTDLAFGLRQLQDVATRALSPGLNDPTTAVLALGQMSAVLCRYAGSPLGDHIVEDEDGQLRVAVARPSFAALLELASGPTRRYGREDPEVMAALLGMLTDVAEHVADTGDRATAVREQVERVLASVDLHDPVDLARVRRVGSLALGALERGSRMASVTDAT